MGIEWVTILMLATFIILLALGLPLPWAMGATATMIGFMLFDPGFMQMMVGRIYDLMLNYALVAVPLFIFMAAILQNSGVVEQLFRAVYIWCGRLRGGLAIATIISCIIMAALVGIIGAEVVTFGLISLPAMLERKYDKKIALGCIAAGGGLATCLAPVGNGVFRRIIRQKERREHHEQTSQALHPGRESFHYSSASGGEGPGIRSLPGAKASAHGLLPVVEGVL